jgi:hypothetical protein
MRRFSLRNFTRIAIILSILIIAIIILALIVFSPAALEQATKIHGVNWPLLSNIGQTYGAVSALLSALALGGVVASLLYQARDVRSASEQALRTFQFDLLKMEMQDPTYTGLLSTSTDTPNSHDSLRKRNFIHMWVTYWEARYRLREMSEAELRYCASNELFSSAEGCQYWADTKDAKAAVYRGRLAQFVKIVDEEYVKAASASSKLRIRPAIQISDVHSSTSPRKPRALPLTVTGVTVTAIAVTGYLARRKLLRARWR